ncbi:MAG: hypothetical protein OXF77_00965, partial [Thaumarchaeota archaeon]|nr:hypothetical protein [Nitrososphaerota archaeon]
MDKRKLGTYYQQVKAELDDKISKANSLLEEIEGLHSEAKTGNTSIQDLSESVTSQVNNISDRVNQLNNEFDKFIELKNQAENSEQGLVATIDLVQGLHQKAQNLIQTLTDVKIDMENLKSGANSIHQEIGASHEESQNILKEIKKIYQLATDTGLANSFDKRRKQLERSVNIWLCITVISMFLAVVGVVIVFLGTNEQQSQWSSVLFTRVTFITPLFLLFFFIASRYTKERDLLERYAFKAVTAVALNSYTKLLRDHFEREEDESRILDFVLFSMKIIYSEPHHQKRDMNLINKNKDRDSDITLNAAESSKNKLDY